MLSLVNLLNISWTSSMPNSVVLYRCGRLLKMFTMLTCEVLTWGILTCEVLTCEILICGILTCEILICEILTGVIQTPNYL